MRVQRELSQILVGRQVGREKQAGKTGKQAEADRTRHGTPVQDGNVACRLQKTGNGARLLCNTRQRRWDIPRGAGSEYRWGEQGRWGELDGGRSGERVKGRRVEGRRGIIYTVGRRRTYTPRSPPFVRCCCVTRGIATPCPYTRVYITSNVRENHLIAENPSKMGLRETAVRENIASNLRFYIFFLFFFRLDFKIR